MLAGNTLAIQFVVLLFLVIIDVAVSVGWALNQGQFDWGKLLDFLKTNVLCLAVPWGVIAALAYLARKLGANSEAMTSVAVFADIVYALIIARLMASISTTFKTLGVDANKPS